MLKRMTTGLLCVTMAAVVLAGCGGQKDAAKEVVKETTKETPAETVTETVLETAADTAVETTEVSADGTEIYVFAAASLGNVMDEIIKVYNEDHLDVNVITNYDSSGTLLEQIQNGYACDIFFSAAQKQMNTLEEGGLLLDGTRNNVVNNQVCIVTLKDSGTAVTGLDNIGEAASIALADGSVPVGKYTRAALVANGQLAAVEDVSTITTQEVSDQLGGVEISEQGNVSKVLMAVVEGSCEVGTVYYSDYVGYEKNEDLQIIETIAYDLTGNVIYPVAQVINDEATEAQTAAAADFEQFILSDTATAVFETYGFDTKVER